MFKKMLVVAAALAAMLAFASTASATIISPGTGGAVSARGTVTFRGNIIATSCTTTTINGTVASPTRVAVTSATFANCGLGVQLIALNPTLWVKTLILPNTWRIDNVLIRLTAPFPPLDCLYLGSLTGTFVPGNPTALRITGNTLRLVRGSGSCTTTPTVTGSLTANAATR